MEYSSRTKIGNFLYDENNGRVNIIDFSLMESIDLENCKNKVGEYLSNETDIDFEFTNITKSLKTLDTMFTIDLSYKGNFV